MNIPQTRIIKFIIDKKVYNLYFSPNITTAAKFKGPRGEGSVARMEVTRDERNAYNNLIRSPKGRDSMEGVDVDGKQY
jgi:hypothetical protein